MDVDDTEPGSALVRQYLLLGLRLGRHIDGLVDAYYGPPGIADRVKAEPIFEVAALRDQERTFRADLDDPAETGMLDADRRPCLQAQAALPRLFHASG